MEKTGKTERNENMEALLKKILENAGGNMKVTATLYPSKSEIHMEGVSLGKKDILTMIGLLEQAKQGLIAKLEETSTTVDKSNYVGE